METHVGFLVKGRFTLCPECAEFSETFEGQPKSKLYRVNVYPYRQTCHSCGVTLVSGQTEAWPELFSREQWHVLCFHKDGTVSKTGPFSSESVAKDSANDTLTLCDDVERTDVVPCTSNMLLEE